MKRSDQRTLILKSKNPNAARVGITRSLNRKVGAEVLTRDRGKIVTRSYSQRLSHLHIAEVTAPGSRQPS